MARSSYMLLHGGAPATDDDVGTPRAEHDVELSPGERSTSRQPLLEDRSVSRQSESSHHETSRPLDGGGLDTLLFGTQKWYVKEEHGVAKIAVLRIGNLRDSCSVMYRTEDGSAEADLRYKPAEGCLQFGQGVAYKEFEVEVIATDSFDTTLNFCVILDNPRTCTIEPRGQRAYVYIVDKDCFPTDEYREEIIRGNEDELDEIGIPILLEFVKYTFTHIQTIWWKSVMRLVLQQLHNVYYFLSILMRVYLVDVILNTHDESTQEKLLIRDNRPMSAIVLAAAWFSPNLLLLAISVFIEEKLDMGYAIRRHLRVNIFRKMLNYSPKSRAQVPIQDMTDSVANLIPTLTADAYLGIFDICQDVGKILCVAIFMISEHPTNVVGLILFPLTISCSLKCRQAKSLALVEKASEAEDSSQNCVAQGCLDFDIIDLYHQKNAVITQYANLLKSQRPLTMEVKMFEFWSNELVPWLSLTAMALYMLVGSLGVLNGHVTVGTFLATINVYKDLGDRFQGVYDRLSSFKGSAKPMLDLTRMFNLPCGLEERERLIRNRMDYALKTIQQSPTQTNWNRVPIKFMNVLLHGNLIHALNASFQLGSIVLVTGEQGCGKARFLKAIADILRPDKGDILCSPHQICLFVRMDPQIVVWANLLENLRFGTKLDTKLGVNTLSQGSASRVKEVFRKIGIRDNHWLMERLDDDIAGKDDSDEIPWFERATHVEKKMIHLARALIYEPQILCLNKPVDDLDNSIGTKVLGLLTEFVNHGHSMPMYRTVFLSSGNRAIASELYDWCDYKVNLDLPDENWKVPDYDVVTHAVKEVRLSAQTAGLAHYARDRNDDSAKVMAGSRRNGVSKTSIQDACCVWSGR